MAAFAVISAILLHRKRPSPAHEGDSSINACRHNDRRNNEGLKAHNSLIIRLLSYFATCRPKYDQYQVTSSHLRFSTPDLLTCDTISLVRMKKPFRKHIKTLFTGFLCLWLSGVIFLVCCESAKGNTVDSCPLAKVSRSAHCYKSELAARFQTTYRDCMEECGMLSALFSGSRKADHLTVLDIVPARAALPTVVSRLLIIKDRPQIFERRQTGSRQNTYLLNRNFRI